MEELAIGITSAIVAVIGAFVLNYLRDKSDEKEKLKVWKMIVCKELKTQKRKISGMKNILNKSVKFPETNIVITLSSIDFNLITDNKVYDYNFASKVLGKIFNIYLNYIEKIENFDQTIEKIEIAKKNNNKPEIVINNLEKEATIKGIDIDELDLIIDKIGKGLK